MSNVVPFKMRSVSDDGPAAQPPVELSITFDGHPILFMSSNDNMVLCPMSTDDRAAVLAMLANAIWVMAGTVGGGG